MTIIVKPPQYHYHGLSIICPSLHQPQAIQQVSALSYYVTHDLNWNNVHNYAIIQNVGKAEMLISHQILQNMGGAGLFTPELTYQNVGGAGLQSQPHRMLFTVIGRKLLNHCSNLQLQLQWTKDIHDRMTSDELARSVAEAERLLELHQERKVKAVR